MFIHIFSSIVSARLPRWSESKIFIRCKDGKGGCDIDQDRGKVSDHTNIIIENCSMRISCLTILLVLVYLCGCSQSTPHNFHDPRKIPIDASRWYVLNSSVFSLSGLSDGKTDEEIPSGGGHVLDNYDVWYPVLAGERR